MKNKSELRWYDKPLTWKRLFTEIFNIFLFFTAFGSANMTYAYLVNLDFDITSLHIIEAIAIITGYIMANTLALLIFGAIIFRGED